MTYSNRRKSFHVESICDEEGMEKCLTQSDENCELAFHILLIFLTIGLNVTCT